MNQELSSVKMIKMKNKNEKKGEKGRKLITTVLKYKNGTEVTEVEQIKAKTSRK